MAERPQYPALSPAQAHYVLQCLIRDGRIREAEAAQYAASVHREIADVEARLERLRSLRGRGSAPQPAAGRSQPSGNGRARNRGRRRTRRGNPLAGRYMGYMRQVKDERKKADFRKIKEGRGLPAAIEALQQHLRK